MNLSIGQAIGRDKSLAFRRGTGGSTVVGTTTVLDDRDGSVLRRRRAALRMVDRQLNKGNFKLALSLVKQLQRQSPPAGLRGFGAARQVPRRVSSVEELHLSATEKSALQSLVDSILESIKSSLQSSPQDEVSLFEQDSSVSGEDDMIEHKQVLHHEVGHFLVGYLLGILPKKYRVSRVEDVKDEDDIADASVKFIGFEFLTEANNGKLSSTANNRKLSSTVLSKFVCVIVGGLVAEHLVFGNSKGHHGDVDKLKKVLRWLHFSEDEASTLIKWAVLNTLLMLCRHGEARLILVEAMENGRSIGNCIDMIESTLNHQDI